MFIPKGLDEFYLSMTCPGIIILSVTSTDKNFKGKSTFLYYINVDVKRKLSIGPFQYN